jgi:hypothetical protein
MLEIFEGSKRFRRVEGWSLFGGLVNKNSYKYMQRGDPKLIIHIKNL